MTSQSNESNQSSQSNYANQYYAALRVGKKLIANKQTQAPLAIHVIELTKLLARQPKQTIKNKRIEMIFSPTPIDEFESIKTAKQRDLDEIIASLSDFIVDETAVIDETSQSNPSNN